MVAACLVVRSLRSLAPERISPVAIFSARDVCLRLTTISLSFSATALVSDLSFSERALVVALDALRQVGLGEGGQHLAGFADAAVDRLAPAR